MNKQIIFFENSSEHLDINDYTMFEKITSNTIENLENKIKKSNNNLINTIYSNTKFIDNYSLNLEGLHIYRTILSNKIYLNRKKTTNKDVEFFTENGFLIIDDFLEKQEFSNLRSLFLEKIKPKKSSNYITRVDSTQFMKRNNKLQELIKDCSRINNFSFAEPRVEFWNLIHYDNDPQSKFHSDTFQPTCKFWLFLEDIDTSKGPFNYAPKSHLLSETRLKWDYENSIMKKDNDIWKKRIQSGGKPGSFRVHENSTIEEEKQTLKNMGYKSIETVGKKNTLVAANTFGFHKRGIAAPQTYRETLSIEYRPQAFWKY